MKICTVQEMRECDRKAVEDYGLSETILMENAGHAVYEVIKREFGLVARRFVVLCGGGNNGGDGLVVARKLHSSGVAVLVYLLVEEDAVSGTARTNLEAAVRAGIPVQRLYASGDLHLVRSSDVIIDAMLGTGLSRSPEGLYAEVIEHLNASSHLVVAVDTPSGVNGDTGATGGVAVRATCTVTFGLPKRGNLLPPGRELCGRLYVTHLSFPPSLYDSVGHVETSQLVPLPARPLESHKSDYGDVLFIAGARSYLGAPVLAAMSFLRAGGGYARLATPATLAPLLGSRASEAVIMPLQETADGSVALSNLDELCAMSERIDMVVAGPGLSLNEETQELVRYLVARVSTPVLVDGDGLSAIARDVSCLRNRRAPTVLTPHAGEMARLLGCAVAEIEQDRVAAVQEAARTLGGIMVLKGSSTLIGEASGPISLNLTGNPGMATAGCGDVLTGTIAAVSGMGLDLRSAAVVGAFLHGLAGDLATEEKGPDGMIATDVVEHLPAATRLYRTSFCELADNYYGRLIVV